MRNRDVRKYNQKTQYGIRKQVVRLRKKGLSNKAVSKILGLCPSHISTIWQKYQRGGIDAIRPGVRGRREGEKRQLTVEQEVGIQTLLLNKTPDRLKLDLALWTREAVRLAIKKVYGVELPPRTLTDYLKRWGIVSQKPTFRDCKQKSWVVQQWFERTYPEIQARAKQEKAEIHWGDRSVIQNLPNRINGFSSKEKTSVVRVNTSKGRINMISSISNQGKIRFMLSRETFTSKVLIIFMSRLIKDVDRKIFLILDNQRVNQTKVVKTWFEENKEQIEVFYL